jgi:hypothetical protein
MKRLAIGPVASAKTWNRRFFVWLAAIGLIACSRANQDSQPIGPAGTSDDAAPLADAGPMADVGPMADAGPLTDASSSTDASAIPDGAQPEDAGGSDAALPADMTFTGDLRPWVPPADLAGTCATGTDDCDHDPATACDSLATALHCGACGVTCFPQGGTNACVADNAGFACQPACDATHADCDGVGANGCEVDLTADPGEPDNGCSGEKLADVSEGSTLTIASHRILPANDTDTYTVTVKEGSHLCAPPTLQPYVVLVTTGAPAGLPLAIKTAVDATTCTNSWSNTSTNGSYCYTFTGTCGLNDERTISFQVAAEAAGASSCEPYSLSVRFCALGSTCDNCM